MLRALSMAKVGGAALIAACWGTGRGQEVEDIA